MQQQPLGLPCPPAAAAAACTDQSNLHPKQTHEESEGGRGDEDKMQQLNQTRTKLISCVSVTWHSQTEYISKTENNISKKKTWHPQNEYISKTENNNLKVVQI